MLAVWAKRTPGDDGVNDSSQPSFSEKKREKNRPVGRLSVVRHVFSKSLGLLGRRRAAGKGRPEAIEARPFRRGLSPVRSLDCPGAPSD